jgi:hypothetical protein
MKNILWLLPGVLLGFALGVGYGWIVHPPEFQGAGPNSLRAEYRGEYLLLIASSYQTTNDLDRARSRLAAFPGMDAAQLGALAQQVAASGGGEQTAHDLAWLALALGKQGPAAGASISPSPRVSITASAIAPKPFSPAEPTVTLAISPLPTRSTQTVLPSATAAARYSLQSKETVCGDAKGTPLQIRVWVKSSAGKGLPGTEVQVRWPGGQGHMVTGMKPDQDAGYADYDIDPGVAYEISLGNGGLTVENLTAPDCAATGGVASKGSLRLIIIAQ